MGRGVKNHEFVADVICIRPLAGVEVLGAVLVGEEEPVAGPQGVKLARNDVAEGQAHIAIW